MNKVRDNRNGIPFREAAASENPKRETVVNENPKRENIRKDNIRKDNVRERIIPGQKKIQGDKNGTPVKGPGTKIIIYSLIMTVILYGALIFVERSLVRPEEKSTVIVAKQDIDAGVKITLANASTYFTEAERVSSELPNSAAKTVDELIGQYVTRDYSANEVINSASFDTFDDRISQIVNPVEVSINANNLEQVVGGVLREGDYVNIWSVKTENLNGINSVTSTKICDMAYVTRTFTSAGVEVAKDGAEESATMVVNIVIPEEQEEAFNNAVADGTVRIGLCLYDEKIAAAGDVAENEETDDMPENEEELSIEPFNPDNY